MGVRTEHCGATKERPPNLDIGEGELRRHSCRVEYSTIELDVGSQCGSKFPWKKTGDG